MIGLGPTQNFRTPGLHAKASAVTAHAEVDQPGDSELLGRVKGPPEEAVGDHEADTWN